MSGGPAISVIINAWNGELFLEEALRSAATQTLPAAELIVFDDASTDGTPDIVRRFADGRLRYLRSGTRIPLGAARRAAIAEARGDWIAFLDQDDLWHPRKLEWQMKRVADDGEGRVGLVYGRTFEFGRGIRTQDHDHRHEFRRLPEGTILQDLFTDSCFIAMSSALVRRSAYEDIGGVPAEFETAFDYGLYTGICRRFDARAVQRQCCWYRVHGDNMSRTSRIQVNLEVLQAIDHCREELGPVLAARRKKVHESLIGLEEIAARTAILGGLRRILTRGSLPYLLTRPLVRTGRALRRWRHRMSGASPGQDPEEA